MTQARDLLLEARARQSLGQSADAIYEAAVSALRRRGVRGTAIDVGCGAGRLYSWLAGVCDAYIGVDAVRYDIGNRKRLGVASTYLAERLPTGSALKVYVQKAHAFGLPADPSVPIIMIGPGTGVAPFRAFLQERRAIGAKGRNWLFFGHQHSDFDFFYEDEFREMKTSGLLTRLSLAWSRDGNEKIYVQDRMREVGRDLWSWLADGAHIYVCGDAKRMAKDVEIALVDIVAQYGMRSPEEATAFVSELKKKNRYQQDVY